MKEFSSKLSEDFKMSEIKKHINFFTILIAVIISNITIIYAQTKDCNECHPSIVSKKIVHGAADDCSICHSSSGNEHNATNNQKGFTLTDKMPDLCYMCHDAKNTKKNVHPPAEEGECTMCHSPHSSDNNALIKENPVSKICYECHDLEIKETDNKHKPVADGECQKCHDPHQSDVNKFLITQKPELCLKCHEKQKKELEMKNVHYPLYDDCANCHKPHSSTNRKLLTDNPPELCYNCHDGQSEIQNSKSVHKPYIDGKSCINCHSPHASNNNKFVIAPGNDLCYTCHNKDIKSEDHTIKNIYTKVKIGKSVHPPIEVDGCTSCHSPHYSNNNFLLNFNYPVKVYVEAKPENFALCFECHDSELLSQEKTTYATNFRYGEKNMHYLHINGKKGRNCNLCHDIHASQNMHLIKEKTKFGNWEMNLNYKILDNGGSCFPGCHGEKKYIRQ